MTLNATQSSLFNRQLAIEHLVTGHNVDPNPLTHELMVALQDIISQFTRVPAWVRVVEEIGLLPVSHVSICAMLDHVSSEGGRAQAHGVIGQIANRLKYLCDLDRKERCQVAWNVLHAMRSCDFVRITTTKKADPTTIVNMTPLFRDLLDAHNLWALCGMHRRPMIYKPIAHTLEAPGGYLTEALRKGVTNGSWSNVTKTQVVDAMNIQQDSTFRVNERVLEVMQYLLEPHMEARETDAYAHDAALAVAWECVGMDIWFPCFIDRRGRVNQADIIGRQGNDLQKNITRFKEGVELTGEGLFWHRVHVANVCSGLPVADGKNLDKIPFEDRVAWTEANEGTLLEIANDPIGHRDLYWDGFASGAQTTAALSAILDLESVHETGMSFIPVMNDAPSQNFQLMAALVRDDKQAPLVNLTDSPAVQDFPTFIAKENARSWLEGERDHDFMTVFLDNVTLLSDRKVAKKPAMVTGYGGKERGIASQFMGKKTWENTGTEDDPVWVRVADPESVISRIEGLSFEQHGDAAFALAKDYKESVYTVARSAMLVTEFLRECVKVASEVDKPMSWTGPSGVRFYNHPTNKVEFNLTASSVFEDQSCAQLKFVVFDDELNKRKALTAVGPQYIHSLDAAILHLTFLLFAALVAAETGRLDVYVVGIHDCYGCHANYMGLMRKAYASVLVAVLSGDPLRVLSESYGVELPEYGDFDLNEIMYARYILH